MYTLAPLLLTNDPDSALNWYRTALGATVVGQHRRSPRGPAQETTLDIHGASVLLRTLDDPVSSTTAPNGPVSLHLMVDDVDAVARAVKLTGVKLLTEPQNHQEQGRVADFCDPFGHHWHLRAPGPAAPTRARRTRAERRELNRERWHTLRAVARAGLAEPSREAMDTIPEYRKVRGEALRYLTLRNVNR